jgi:hypothetical protein
MPKAVRKITTIKNIAPDAELIALGRLISELRVQERASDAECRALLRAKDDAAEALDAVEARADAIGDEMSKLYDRMLELKPTTLEGYRAFALSMPVGRMRSSSRGTPETGRVSPRSSLGLRASRSPQKLPESGAREDSLPVPPGGFFATIRGLSCWQTGSPRSLPWCATRTFYYIRWTRAKTLSVLAVAPK